MISNNKVILLGLRRIGYRGLIEATSGHTINSKKGAENEF